MSYPTRLAVDLSSKRNRFAIGSHWIAQRAVQLSALFIFGLKKRLKKGRCKSLIVEEDAYLGSLQHYVHLNPVRAKMCSVSGLKDYRWSS